MKDLGHRHRAPIAFFAYNRPEHTRQALETLCKCDGALESELFIYCDGAKGPKDEKAVKKVREIVKSCNWCGSVHVVEHDVNLGLANSIIHGEEYSLESIKKKSYPDVMPRLFRFMKKLNRFRSFVRI